MTVIHHDFGGPAGPPASGVVKPLTAAELVVRVLDVVLMAYHRRASMSEADRAAEADKYLESAARNQAGAAEGFDGLGQLAEMRYAAAQILKAPE